MWIVRLALRRPLLIAVLGVAAIVTMTVDIASLRSRCSPGRRSDLLLRRGLALPLIVGAVGVLAATVAYTSVPTSPPALAP